MSDAVIVAIVTSVLTLIGTVITVLAANKQTLSALDKKSELSDAQIKAQLERHQAVTDTKIDELTRKVDKHNNLIERTYKLESDSAALQTRVERLEHSQ